MLNHAVVQYSECIYSGKCLFYTRIVSQVVVVMCKKGGVYLLLNQNH